MRMRKGKIFGIVMMSIGAVITTVVEAVMMEREIDDKVREVVAEERGEES